MKAEEINLYASGVPVSDEDLASAFENKDIELTVGLPGGKVHGSLARAGKFYSVFYCFKNISQCCASNSRYLWLDDNWSSWSLQEKICTVWGDFNVCWGCYRRCHTKF